MNRQYDLEDLEDFLGGRMSDSDRANFELALASDAELQKRLEALRAEAKVEQLLREELLFEQFGEWDKENEEKARKKRRRILLVAALALLLGLAGLVLFRSTREPAPANEAPVLQPDSLPGKAQTTPEIALKPDGPQTEGKAWAALAKKAFVEEDFSQTLMGAGNEGKPEDAYTLAVKQYNIGKYDAALTLLAKPDPKRMEEFLYLRGYTYYHLQRFEKAEQDFREFRNFPVSDRKMDALWSEACCMLQQMPAAAKRLDLLLQEIESNPDNPYADRARTLRKELHR